MYTIVGNRNDGYTVGIGLKRKLKWQISGLFCILLLISAALTITGLAIFIGTKFLTTLPIWLICFAALYIVLASEDRNFKLLPYKTDVWSWSIKIEKDVQVTTVDLLERLQVYDNLSNFVNINELIEEAVGIIRLNKNNEITDDELAEYNITIGKLINECERAKTKELLNGRSNYDSVLTEAIEVAKNVNNLL
jgi:hypothetical protein